MATRDRLASRFCLSPLSTDCVWLKQMKEDSVDEKGISENYALRFSSRLFKDYFHMTYPQSPQAI
jgi:hypothetical protein